MAQAWSPEQMEALALLQEGMRRIYADEDAALVLDWLHGQTGKAPATPDDVLRWGESFAFYDQVLADRALRSLLPPEQRKEISFPWKSYNLHIDTPDEGMLMLLGAGPGSGKCLGKGTKLLMYDGTRKAVEDVVVGDQLMGVDSKPRNVLSLARGREMMYWVHQSFGMSYRVNKSHILSLKRSKIKGKKYKKGDVINVPVSDVVVRGSTFLKCFSGYKVAVEFPEKATTLDPYFLGLWLGDGSKYTSSIFKPDQEVADYLGEYAASRGKGETVVVSQLDRSCPCLRITGGRSQVARDSSVAAELRHLGVLENKHIPQEYLLNSKAMRLRLLAGLIDSDGHYDRRGKNGAYEIAMIDQQLVEQIKFLCDSLGYRTSISDRISRSQNGYEVRSWRVYFNGNVDEIPTKIMRKQATAWTSNVNWTLSRITLQQDKVDDYYGFAIDGDRLFLLEDGTVTHNTIKGEMILEHNAKRGLRSGLYNFELNRTVMLDRRAVRHAQYDRRSFKQGLLTEAQIAQLDEETPLWVKPEDRQGLGDWQKLSRQLRKALDEANARMKGWAGAIDYWFTPGWDIDKLCATIYAEHMQNPYNLVAVDYLEKIQPSARQRKLFGTNKLDREEDNVEQLKTLAEKLRIPLLVLSQLSKAGRAKNAEDMDGTEVRGAGAKTERSNINVLFSIDKGDDAVPDPSIKDGVMLSVAITKNTMGSCGTFRMFRNGARFTIHDTTKQELDA